MRELDVDGGAPVQKFIVQAEIEWAVQRLDQIERQPQDDDQPDSLAPRNRSRG